MKGRRRCHADMLCFLMLMAVRSCGTCISVIQDADLVIRYGTAEAAAMPCRLAGSELDYSVAASGPSSNMAMPSQHPAPNAAVPAVRRAGSFSDSEEAELEPQGKGSFLHQMMLRSAPGHAYTPRLCSGSCLHCDNSSSGRYILACLSNLDIIKAHLCCQYLMGAECSNTEQCCLGRLPFKRPGRSGNAVPSHASNMAATQISDLESAPARGIKHSDSDTARGKPSP